MTLSNLIEEMQILSYNNEVCSQCRMGRNSIYSNGVEEIISSQNLVVPFSIYIVSDVSLGGIQIEFLDRYKH